MRVASKASQSRAAIPLIIPRSAQLGALRVPQCQGHPELMHLDTSGRLRRSDGFARASVALAQSIRQAAFQPARRPAQRGVERGSGFPHDEFARFARLDGDLAELIHTALRAVRSIMYTDASETWS